MKIAVILTVLCFVLAGMSFAGNVVITEVLTGGSLTLTMPSNFSIPGLTLGGAQWPQSASTSQTYTVEDSRGTGVGWNLGFQCSQFRTGGTPNRTLPTYSFDMTLSQGNITAVYGQAVDPTNGPKAVTAGENVYTTEIKFANALAGYGMGKYNLALGHDILTDFEVYAGTYTATLTATLNAVP